jgi:hypothetical protein
MATIEKDRIEVGNGDAIGFELQQRRRAGIVFLVSGRVK